MTFNKGDKVKVKEGVDIFTPGIMDEYTGRLGTVITVYSDCIAVQMDGGYLLPYLPEELELAK